MTLTLPRSASAVLVAAVFVSCDSDSGSMSPDGNTVPSIAVGVNPQSTSVPQGGSTQISATVTKTNFSGPVSLSVTGTPASISVNISQPPVTGAVAAGLITFIATSATAPGTYNLTIQAAATGVSPAVTPFVLTVSAIGSFTLASTASGIAITQGSSGTVQIAIVRDQFASLIDLEAVALPSGASGTFVPNPVTGNTATLTLGVAANVPLGSYSLSLRGSSAGSPERNVPLLLMVGPLTTFTFTASPVPVSIAQGASRSVAISFVRGASFSTAIGLAVEGAPQGLTPALNPALVSGTSSTLTLSAASNLAVGMYALTIRAGTAGNPEQTLSLPVLVTAP